LHCDDGAAALNDPSVTAYDIIGAVDTNPSRRTFSALIPAVLAAHTAMAQESSKRLPSKAFKFEDLPVKVNGANKSRAVFDGETHSGFPIEVHVTELAPDSSPHAPHRHVHEEMFFLQTGILDSTVNGVTTRLTPGSICYVNSNELHGVHNPGPGRAQYCVTAFGTKSPSTFQ
jgi:mannose-6-phosphate isomerase-like protein (cupin superfamily)